MIEEKPWYLSRTIWGSLIAVAAPLASLAGVSIDNGTQSQLADILIQLTGAFGGLLAVYGRLSATEIIA